MQSGRNVSRKLLCLFCFKAILVLVIVILLIQFYSVEWDSQSLARKAIWNVSSVNTSAHDPIEYPTPPKGFLVWSNSCHMPDVDPFTKDAMDIFKRQNYTLCSNEKPLTKLLFDMNSQTYSLRLQTNDTDISCCSEAVQRSGTGRKVDNEFKLENCEPFSSDHVLPSTVDSVLIKCKSKKKQKLLQRDAYFLVREKPEVRAKLNSYKNLTDPRRPVSVVMWGIDTMSRFNLRRAMPETTKKLTSGNWFELSGYNKIDDNTFPNLMAILSGYSMDTIRDKCDLVEPGGLDNCNLIWNVFRNNGYVTGYAEDESWMSTFNYLPNGFKNPPVDYYHRPFMLAIEHSLKIKHLSGMTFCIGQRHAAEYVYDFAMDLATRFKSEPYFGLFWTNTFSHNAFDDASAMDVRIAEYLDELHVRGVLDDSIVIFFSDHGTRFGSIRQLKQGFLDERLPFFFIWLPSWFRAQHPTFVSALRLNRHRLTSPYDIHMTLQHVLALSGRSGGKPMTAFDCPRCQSIFLPVPAERTCKDAGIDDHWCTCVPFENLPTGNVEVIRATNAAISHLNSYLNSKNLIPPCANLTFVKILEAQIKLDLGIEKRSSDTVTYRVRFTAQSEASFEASIAHSKTSGSFSITDAISRLDAYASKSECISNAEAKKYCICMDKINE